MRNTVYKVAVLATIGLGTFLVVFFVGLWWRGYFS